MPRQVMRDKTPLKNGKPHPENYVWPEDCKIKVSDVVEILEFKTLKQSGLLVKVLYDGGRKSTWLHSKDFTVFSKYYGGTAAITTVYG